MLPAAKIGDEERKKKAQEPVRTRRAAPRASVASKDSVEEDPDANEKSLAYLGKASKSTNDDLSSSSTQKKSDRSAHRTGRAIGGNQPSSFLRGPSESKTQGQATSSTRKRSNLSTSQNAEDLPVFQESNERSQPFVRQTNERGWPLGKSDEPLYGAPLSYDDQSRQYLALSREYNVRGQSVTLDFNERNEPPVQESNERGPPVTHRSSERAQLPAEKRHERDQYSQSMETGTSDINRLGPSSHARKKNVVQPFHQGTAACGVISLDVRNIDTLRIKTAPGFYLRTDASGMEAVLPSQMFYQYLSDGAATLHQEFILHIDDAKNPQQELIGSCDVPTDGKFEGFEMSNAKMSDVQSAIISAQPRRRSERIAKPAVVPEAQSESQPKKKNTANRFFPDKKRKLAEDKLPVPTQVMGDPNAFSEDFGMRSPYAREHPPDYSDYMPGAKRWSHYDV